MADILLYHYYFADIEKPLVIQAENREQARLLVPQAIELSDMHRGKTPEQIISETVAEPVSGISRRIIEGNAYLWAGQGIGWVPEETYEARQ